MGIYLYLSIVPNRISADQWHGVYQERDTISARRKHWTSTQKAVAISQRCRIMATRNSSSLLRPNSYWLER